MIDITVLIGCFVVLLWSWRRVYLHIMRKDGRPLIAHMISFLLALFPARFFAFACLSIFPPEGVEPVTDMKRFFLCGLFVLSVIGLLILTRKRNVPKEVSPELIENTDASEDISSNELSKEMFQYDLPSTEFSEDQPSKDSSKKSPEENNETSNRS